MIRVFLIFILAVLVMIPGDAGAQNNRLSKLIRQCQADIQAGLRFDTKNSDNLLDACLTERGLFDSKVSKGPQAVRMGAQAKTPQNLLRNMNALPANSKPVIPLYKDESGIESEQSQPPPSAVRHYYIQSEESEFDKGVKPIFLTR